MTKKELIALMQLLKTGDAVHGHDINAMLWYAALYNLPEYVRSLLDSGADADYKNEHNETVLNAVFKPIEPMVTSPDAEGYRAVEFSNDSMEKKQVTLDMLKCIFCVVRRSVNVGSLSKLVQIGGWSELCGSIVTNPQTPEAKAVHTLLFWGSILQTSPDILLGNRLLALLDINHFPAHFLAWCVRCNTVGEYLEKQRASYEPRKDVQSQIILLRRTLRDEFGNTPPTRALLVLMGRDPRARTPAQHAFCERLLVVSELLPMEPFDVIEQIQDTIMQPPAELYSADATIMCALTAYLRHGALSTTQQQQLARFSRRSFHWPGYNNMLFYVMEGVVAYSKPETVLDLHIFLATLSFKHQLFWDRLQVYAGENPRALTFHSCRPSRLKRLNISQLLKDMRPFWQDRLLESRAAGEVFANTISSRLPVSLWSARNDNPERRTDFDKTYGLVVYQPIP